MSGVIDEIVGTARLALVIDTEQWQAGVARGEAGLKSFGQTAQQAFQQADANAKRSMTNLSRYVELIGKSADEVQLLRAAWQGVPKEVIAEMASRIDAARAATEKAAVAARERAQAEREQALAVAAREQAIAANAARAQASSAAITSALMRERAQIEQLTQARQRDLLAMQESNAARAQSNSASITSGLMRERAAREDFLSTLQRETVAIGKNRSELLQMKAAELGVEAQAAPFIKMLRDQERALLQTSNAFNKYGLTAKMEMAALRQVPAQMTDIFVSLQGGQNPLTVLLQQGGQLRDIFGGARPAIEAIGRAVLRLVNANTLLAGGVGVLAFAYYQAERRQEAYAKSLILTGRYSAENIAFLREHVAALDELSGVTSNQAAAAIAEVAANGRIPLEVMDKVTQAAVQMQNVAGKAVADTVSEFAEMARDPVQAVLRLNESEGFLTRSILDQIQALQDQGQYAEAAKLAMESRADVLIERGERVRESMGLISGAMYDIRHKVPEIWDWMVDGMDRVDRKAKESLDTLTEWFSKIPMVGAAGGWGMMALTNPASAANSGGSAPTGGDAVNSEAARRFKQLQDQFLSREERHKRELDQIRNTGKEAGAKPEDIAAALAAAEARYQESLSKSVRGLDSALSEAALQKFKDALAQRQNAIENATDVMNALRAAGMMSDEAYYAKSRDLVQQDAAAQEEALRQQIAFLQQRNVTGKDAANVQKELGQLESQLAQVRADATTKLKVLQIQEDAALKARKEAIEDYKNALDLSNAALSAEVNAQIAAIGMGQREAEQKEALAQVYRKLADELARLTLLKTRDAAHAADYDAQMVIAQQAADAEVAILMDKFARMDAARGDWLNGAASAWADWVDSTRDVASQTANITTALLDGAASSIVDLFARGKDSAREFLADIATMLTEFFAKQAVMKFGMMFLGSFFGASMPAQAGAQAFGNNTSWLTDGSFGGNAGGGFTLNAKGNVYAAPALSAYSNQVYDKPTLFAFAKGMGVFGEAGQEAIMPLKRGPDGNLGVRAYGAGDAGGGVVLNVTTNVYKDGSSDTTSSAEGVGAELYKGLSQRIAEGAQAEIQKSLRPGGVIWAEKNRG